ncbi:MAG: hypothetical protein LBD11_01350 [Candidatus Peribacteria bacterium]|jgi:lactate dehydrogenase-like 2-hydroxyacid dehydrogenase|nr:hypothetical protein [Candidatus Peribacteria bacterium]
MEYCKEHNIAVYNLPNYSTQSVAEYLVFFAFCLTKKLPLQLKNGGKEDFSNSFLTQNLHEKHIGIVGLGNI